MSVTPIACVTVAEGLACGRRTLGGCCAKASDAAHAMTKSEIIRNETRFVEVIFYLLTAECGAHYNAAQFAHKEVRG
jgi:hypothetical protein